MAEGDINATAAQEPTAPVQAAGTPNPAPAPAPALNDEGNTPIIQPGEGEKKPDEGNEPIITAPKEDDKKPEGAPEKYESFTVPEGFKLDEARVTDMSNLFKELNLTQGNAQKLVDAYCKYAQEQASAQQNADMEMRKTWRNEIRSRSDFREQRALMEKGFRLLVKTDKQKALFANTDSWLSDSPELFDLFVSAGRLVAEDNMSRPTSQQAQPTEAQINMARFPNL